MSWKSPTSGNGQHWANIPFAYDDNEGSCTTYPATGYYWNQGDWTTFLSLFISPAILCDKVRIKACSDNGDADNIEVDVRWDGEFHTIYSGDLDDTGNPQWYEYDLGGIYTVDAMMVKFRSASDENGMFVYEADFNQVSAKLIPHLFSRVA
jgi:hypothetical protein